MSRLTQLTVRSLLTFGLLAGAAGELRAVEIAARADRTQLPLGEEFKVTVTVRGSPIRPSIQPPSVPGCQIEQVGALQATPSRRVAGQPGPAPQVGQSIQDLERQIQARIRALGQMPLADPALNDPALLQQYQDLLAAYRQQALAALNGQTGTDYTATFRIKPERSGILTLPPFIIRLGNQTVVTKPIEITITEASTPAPTPPPAAAQPQPAPPPAVSNDPAPAPAGPPLPAPYDADEVLGSSGVSAHVWPWLVAVLFVPPLAVGLLWVGWRWRRTREATAAVRQQRQAVRQARQELSVPLTDSLTPAALGELLIRYLRGRCAVPDGEITPAEAAQCLEQAAVPPAVAERFAVLLDTCTAARYAPGAVTTATAELVQEARAVIDEIERTGLWLVR
jgi:hypothetical protein